MQHAPSRCCWRLALLRAAAASLLLAPLLLLAPVTPVSGTSFVKACGAQLCVDGKPWYFQGANAYWLIDYVQFDRGSVDIFFDWANKFGLKVIRLWAFNHRMRNNTYNARRYKDDPTIMMYDAMNEPRCPGCVDTSSQAQVRGFLAEMTSHLRAVAPSQLVALGTEGYFLNSYEEWNSGGAWGLYLSVHQRIAAGAKKPLIMEEYGLILPQYTADQRVQLFQLVADNLRWMKSTGGAMAGVMFWNAAVGNVWDDGYNVYLDGPVVKPVPVPAPTPPPQPPSGVTPAGPVPTPAPAPPAPAPPPEPSRAPIVANTETLTDFLRGPQRAACAEAAAKWWLPIWTNSWAYTVDTTALAKRTATYTVLSVLRDTSNALYY
eukprot:XP_001699837.1 predicted protein [Chlamydomonas reinhardtii]